MNALLLPVATGDHDVDCAFALLSVDRPMLRTILQRMDDAAAHQVVDLRTAQLVFWDETPLDLFFDYVPIHSDAARHRRSVPFAGTRIPVLGPIELAVFKVMFDRTRDWADVEAMLGAGTLDLDAVASGPLEQFVGDTG